MTTATPTPRFAPTVRTAEGLLRDMAFVLKMTAKVSGEIRRQRKAEPRRRPVAATRALVLAAV